MLNSHTKVSLWPRWHNQQPQEFPWASWILLSFHPIQNTSSSPFAFSFAPWVTGKHAVPSPNVWAFFLLLLILVLLHRSERTCLACLESSSTPCDWPCGLGPRPAHGEESKLGSKIGSKVVSSCSTNFWEMGVEISATSVNLSVSPGSAVSSKLCLLHKLSELCPHNELTFSSIGNDFLYPW